MKGVNQMNGVSLDELAALRLVLECIGVKDLLVSAMNGFAQHDDIRSQDNADLCSKAVHSFLN